jgi:hypothetical protein
MHTLPNTADGLDGVEDAGWYGLLVIFGMWTRCRCALYVEPLYLNEHTAISISLGIYHLQWSYISLASAIHVTHVKITGAISV